MRISYVVLGCMVLAAFLAHDVRAAENDENPYATERQALREESASIRTEHDALEAEREKLKTRCLDARGQDKNDCEQAREDLHQRRLALQERVKALVDKIHADRAHGHQGITGPHDMAPRREGITENPPPDDVDQPSVSVESLSK